MKNKKRAISAVALSMAALMALTGTFAWQSISQKAKNEARGIANPGGRLHDDFDGTNKDIYVENFTDKAKGGVPIYARIKLSQYMELGEDAGKTAGENGKPKQAKSLVAGAQFDDVNTWTTYTPGETTFSAYWTWTEGTNGDKYYMPTFNKNKDSLKADVNGTLAGLQGTPYDDYVEYKEADKKTADEVYDNDNNNIEEDPGEEEVNIKTIKNVDHTAKQVHGGTVQTMAQWKEAGSKPGDFWVWDTDGWAYWANPIEPGETTGLLLDKIELTGKVNTSCYYGINVVGEFITADDLGRKDGTGFYAGTTTAPSSDALDLLKVIGVDTEEAKTRQTPADTVDTQTPVNPTDDNQVEENSTDNSSQV